MSDLISFVIRNSTALIAPGVISGLGFISLLAGAVPTIDRHIATNIVLLIQWQLMGLTISKFGLDQLLLAHSTGGNGRIAANAYVLSRICAPIALIFGGVVALVHGPMIALLLVVSVLFDCQSILLSSALNSMGRHSPVARGAFLNHPFFLGLLIASSYYFSHTTTSGLTLFVVSSFARWYSLHLTTSSLRDRTQWRPKLLGWLGAQQVANYWIFRGDQILIPTLSSLGVALSASVEIRDAVLLAKIAELFSGLFVAIQAVLFPALMNHVRNESHARSTVGKLLIVSIATAPFLALCLHAATAPFRQEPSIWLAVPFALHIALILSVNTLTLFSLRIRSAKFVASSALLASILPSLLVLAIAHSGSISTTAYWWLVPTQLILYSLFCFASLLRDSAAAKF